MYINLERKIIPIDKERKKDRKIERRDYLDRQNFPSYTGHGSQIFIIVAVLF